MNSAPNKCETHALRRPCRVPNRDRRRNNVWTKADRQAGLAQEEQGLRGQEGGDVALAAGRPEDPPVANTTSTSTGAKKAILGKENHRAATSVWAYGVPGGDCWPTQPGGCD
jgi:hypothetical protein